MSALKYFLKLPSPYDRLKCSSLSNVVIVFVSFLFVPRIVLASLLACAWHWVRVRECVRTCQSV